MSRAQKERSLAVIVLAAGEGKRFRSAVPKVLHTMCGRPLLASALDAADALKPARGIVVIGRASEQVEEVAKGLTKLAWSFVLQKQLLGTADAVRVADEALGDFEGDVVVLQGDAPLLQVKTLRRLVAHHRKQRAAATLLTAELEDPSRYGRVVRGPDGQVERIVEQTDATASEKLIKEVNGGVYVFDRAALRAALTKVERDNKQGEFYLTDVFAVFKEKGEKVLAVPAAEPREILGVKTRAQLAHVEKLVRARVSRTLMENGVTIVDPEQTYIDPTVKIGRDTIIHPMTFLTGSTVVASNAEIGPNVRIKDSRIRERARIWFAVLDGADVGADATVGPFAYLRPGSVLKRKAKVGTFVEVKASSIGEGSKVPHLSYIGDATIGKDVNVGASTVTLNYDSETKKKSKTVVGDGAKIGGDTMLVAPVKIGKGAVTGAGSVVTRDVPANMVVYGAPARPRRKRKPAAEGEKK